MGDGPAPDRAVDLCRPGAVDEDRCRESLVLDLVLVAAVVALFALVSAVAARVERL